MATTYLTLVNNVLNELNEPELTSSTFSSSRGIQTAVKKFVLKSMHEVYSALSEIPDLYKSTYQVTNTGQRTYSLPASASPQSGDLAYRKIDWDTFRLVPTELITNGEFTSAISSWTNATTGDVGEGTPAYNSGGNGRCRLNDAAVSQSISTVKNKTYRIQVRVVDSSSGGSSLAIKVGTSAHDTTDLSDTVSVTNYGEGNVLDTVFTASVATTYVTVINSDANNLDVDYVRVSEDIPIKKLKYLSYDDWNTRYLERDLRNSESAFSTPDYVYPTQDKKFGLSPVPDKSNYEIQYEYWKIHTDLSAHGDTMDLDDRFKDLIITRSNYHAYKLRSDPQAAQMAYAEYEKLLQIMRSEYITIKSYMRDTRI